MKLRHLLFLVLLTLGYCGSVVGDAWMMWDHLHTFHGIEHVCHHDKTTGACSAHHTSMRCLCHGGHGDADRLLYTVVNGDTSQRHHHPVAVLPSFRITELPDAKDESIHPTYRIQRSFALASAPDLLSRGLRAPPAAA